MAFSGQMDFQDASSPIMQELMTFHDHALMIIFMICTLILYMISILVKSEYTNKFTLDAQTIEIIWTVIPAAILITMALPSLNILYEMDENNNPLLTIKATAHQWYWTYEYTDFNELMFDAFMTPTESLYEANFRLLETDNRVELCYLQPIRVVVTSEDVLHSWAVPSLGQKVDAIPGRLNQSSFCPTRLGIFYGQCSEICGANHSFMPIVIETLPFPLFQDWTLYKH